MSQYIIRCEFPDGDQHVYVTQESIMGKTIKKFPTYEDAMKYARENLEDFVYNIFETNE